MQKDDRSERHDESDSCLGLTVKKEDDVSKWYIQVLQKAEMMEYHEVSGCYVIRPLAQFVWKSIQRYVDRRLEEFGVREAYFPMFVTKKSLEIEQNHIDGFAPELAWVTRCGSDDMQEPVALRPTSEAIMYPHYSKWLRSHRDLPLKLNQWCNVIRWELKSPHPFLRTREFLWQEGHCAHYTKEGSDKEVLEILEMYRYVYEELLAIPVVKGMKSENEKFPGGLYTTTIEAFVEESGRGIQAGTSHSLGQNFSKMFDIKVENESQEPSYVWQTSWGITTRSIGILTMVHGDNKGLVLPPRVAEIQVVIVPCGLKSSEEEMNTRVLDRVEELRKILAGAGIRCFADTKDIYTPAWKFNHWELRGVPVRAEIGPIDLRDNKVSIVKRNSFEKSKIEMDGNVHIEMKRVLDQIQVDMLERARERLRKKTQVIMEDNDNLDLFRQFLDEKNIVLIPWCEGVDCEEQIKKKTQNLERGSMGAKSLCIPFDQPTDRKAKVCLSCKKDAKSFTLFGRSY